MFEVAADASIRFVGRFSGPLAVPFAALGLTGTPPSGRMLEAGDLTRLLTDAGLQEVTEVPLTVEVAFSDFTTWWEPYTLAVGTAGSHFVGLDEEQQGRVVALLRAELGDGPFTLTARAWAASGVR